MMVPLVPAYNIRRLVTLERMPHNAAVRLKRPERRDCSKSADASTPNQQRK